MNTGDQFYSELTNYLLTEDKFEQYGYPCLTSRLGVASIKRVYRKFAKVEVLGPDAKRHKCCRCGRAFVIYEDGHQTDEICIYHPQKLSNPKGQLC